MSVLAIDLGGTRIKTGVVHEGRVLAHEFIPARSDEGLAARLPDIVDSLNRMATQAGLDPCKADGVGLGFPGIVDRTAGRVLATNAKYDDAAMLDLAAWARANWGLSFHIENDARLAGIAEWRLGAGQGSDNLAVVTLGTGIGTCVITAGQVFRGPHGQAGILGGHFTLDAQGPLCTCGNRGCAESLASNVVLDAQVRAEAGFSSSLLAGEERIDYRKLFAAVRQGDGFSQTISARHLRVWSALCVSLIHAYDLDRVVLGGGVMNNVDIILPAIRDYVHQHAWTPWGKPGVVPCALHEHAALLAAEWLVQEKINL